MSEFKCPEPGCDYHVGISNGPNLTAEDWESEQYYFQEIEEHERMHVEQARLQMTELSGEMARKVYALLQTEAVMEAVRGPRIPWILALWCLLLAVFMSSVAFASAVWLQVCFAVIGVCALGGALLMEGRRGRRVAQFCAWVADESRTSSERRVVIAVLDGERYVD